MDALYIINSKTKECLITKEFRENDNNSKLALFIKDLDKVILNEKSPFIIIQKSVFVHLEENDIMFISLLSQENLILSVFKILENLKEAVKQSLLVLNTDNLRDNFINITLLIDQCLVKGYPIFNEIPVMSSLICPNSLTNKLTEKFVGKVKEYDTKTLYNYMKDLQVNEEGYKYNNETSYSTYQILFDFYDNLECCVDKNFQITSKIISSDIMVKSNYLANVDCTLLLNVPFDYLDFTFDSSIKTTKKEFIKTKNVELTTKHGNYSLINYIPIMNNIYLPFKIIANTQQVNNQMNLTITIEPIAVKDTFYDIIDLNIKLHFPEYYENSSLSPSIGEFEFESKEKTKIGNWIIPKIDKSTGAASLKGNIAIDGNKYNDKKIVLVLAGIIDKYSITGGKVEKLFIKKDPANSKFFKGTKNITNIKSLELVI